MLSACRVRFEISYWVARVDPLTELGQREVVCAMENSSVMPALLELCSHLSNWRGREQELLQLIAAGPAPAAAMETAEIPAVVESEVKTEVAEPAPEAEAAVEAATVETHHHEEVVAEAAPAEAAAEAAPVETHEHEVAAEAAPVESSEHVVAEVAAEAAPAEAHEPVAAEAAHEAEPVAASEPEAAHVEQSGVTHSVPEAVEQAS